MSIKITFVNPNSSDEVDKYLPKILAEAVLNKIAEEIAYEEKSLAESISTM